jgi:hypothetical protein
MLASGKFDVRQVALCPASSAQLRQAGTAA